MQYEMLVGSTATLQVATWYAGLQVGIATFLTSIFAFLPNLIAFVIILLVGYLIVRAFVKAIDWGMKRVNLETHMGHTRVGQAVERSGHSFTDIVVTTVKWVFYFIVIVYAISALGIPPLTASMQAILGWIPNLIGVAVILFAGLLIGSWIGKGLENGLPRYGVQGGRIIGMVVELMIYLFVFNLALTQIGIAQGILFVLNTALSWGLAAALAVGLGSALFYGLREVIPGIVSGSTTIASTLKPGQTVTIEGMPNVGQGDGGRLSGEVSSVGMFNTVLRRRGGGYYVVPNDLLVDKTLIVESGEEPRPFEHGMRDRMSDLNSKFQDHMDDMKQQEPQTSGNNTRKRPQYLETGQRVTYESSNDS